MRTTAEEQDRAEDRSDADLDTTEFSILGRRALSDPFVQLTLFFKAPNYSLPQLT